VRGHSLSRLGVGCIDLYYQHRVDTRVITHRGHGECQPPAFSVMVSFMFISFPFFHGSILNN
jgi:aryl-alcohol dehydrogenase-like predicted oxidoreductase